MIGVFDSGLGGLTVLHSVASRLPSQSFIYLGDHANVPYGDRTSHEIISLTRTAIERLFTMNCSLVLLGCNTATAVAARTLQRDWLPRTTQWQGRNILGIVAPTVEAATQTPWAVTTPQYPQKHNRDLIVVFGTTRTVASNVYPEEIAKRCPETRVIQQACPGLVDAIESGATTVSGIVGDACNRALSACNRQRPDRIILGCTHFPLAKHIFEAHLPADVRIISQPNCVADSLLDYLARHPKYVDANNDITKRKIELLTTGNAAQVNAAAQRIWPGAPQLRPISLMSTRPQ